MQTNLTEREIEFLGMYYTPSAMIENLMPRNENAPQTWNDNCPTLTLHDFQHAMLNYAPCFADDPKLSKNENFRIKKLAGDLNTIGSRNTGKSLLLKYDLLLSVVYKVFQICLASFDDYHLKKIATPIADYLEQHKFFEIFHLRKSRKESVQRNPLNAKFENGVMIGSVNEHVKGNNPGEQFHNFHYNTLYYEESSYQSIEGTKKRIDSCDLNGYIYRPSGIPDLDVGSPLGKILKDPKKKPWLWQLPQFVRPEFTEKTYQEKVDEYSGENSASFRLNVLAETVEGAFGFFDMERIRTNSINESRRVKFFEIGKESFNNFEESLIVERLPGADQVFIMADLGQGAAPTEIIIIFRVGKVYKYVYNISIFRLLQAEQEEIFWWLYNKLGGAFVAIDATSDSGVIIDGLFKRGVPQENLLKVKFNENIEVGFEKTKDSNGNEIVLTDKNGDPVMKMANTEQFSFEELERVLSDGSCDLAWDDKLITQLTNVICRQIGLKKAFDSKGANHIVQAFQVWAICRFYNEFNILKNQQTGDRCFGVFNVREKK